MAYGVKYSGGTVDRLGTTWTVYILENEYSGNSTSILLSGETPIQEYYNKKERVYGRTVKIRIVNNLADKFEFAELNQSNWKDIKLELYKDSALYFEGYLLPQTYSQNYDYAPLIVLTFSDGLSMLQYDYQSFLDDSEVVFREEIDILKDILYNTVGWDYLQYIGSSLIEHDLGAFYDPMLYTDVHMNAFKKDGENDDSLTILNKILDSYNMDLFIMDGKYYIERFQDRGGYGSSKQVKTIVYDYSTDSKQSTHYITKNYIDLDSLELKTDISYSIDPPLHLFQLKLDTSSYDNNLMKNGVELWDPGTDWTLEQLWNIGSIRNVVSFHYEGGDCFSAEVPQEGYVRISNNNDDVVLKLGFKYHSRSGISDGCTLGIRYKLSFEDITHSTKRYLQSDGSLGTTEAILEEDIDNTSGSTMFDFSVDKNIDLSGKLDNEGLTGVVLIRLTMCTPMYRTTGYGDWHCISFFYMGDFEMTINQPVIHNLYEADFQNNQVATEEHTLYLYDTDYVHFFQSKYRYDNHLNTTGWDDNYLTDKTLQEHYIWSMGQLYESGVPKLNIEVTDDIDIKIDDIFESSKFKDDLGNNMKFYIVDYRYDIREHVYKLTLSQWIDTIGKNLG